jgi:hypothetical protein
MAVGLSLSICVRDIVEGKIHESRVPLIVAGTRAETPEQFAECLAFYADTYWHPRRSELGLGTDFTAECVRTAWMFWDEGRIVQPRVEREGACVNIAHGWWVSTEAMATARDVRVFDYLQEADDPR